MKLIVVLMVIIYVVNGDIYMHNPRGSNNRLNNANRDRKEATRLFNSQNNARGGYNVGERSITYHAGSQLLLEWTNQHSCGHDNNNCEIVIQYMCGPEVRDGDFERRSEENNPCNRRKTRCAGTHEDAEYYSVCKNRPRNANLFTADQNLQGDTAIYTRQNNDGTRYGYECPEERDYYPYWHPSPWKDIAVFTNNPERCSYYKSESENVKGRHGGNGHDIAPPHCAQAEYSRDNHNGNGIDGQHNTYLWTIPSDISEEDSCVVRIRYNISTGDYDAWDTDASDNDDLEGNPKVTIFDNLDEIQLQLAINTAQFGRTFQDRSHAFKVKPKPTDLCPGTIHNVNVRGKRGNLQQVYPAVELDFVPNELYAEAGDCVHFQWTGSDTNNKNNANNGNQEPGKDRSNLIKLKDNTLSKNFPANLNEDFLGFDSDTLKTLINDAGNEAYFDLGVKKLGANTDGKVYNYFCPKNNQFTNRAQKASIAVGGNFNLGTKSVAGDNGQDGVKQQVKLVDLLKQLENTLDEINMN